jgi:flagellin-specific chaperone FliS
MSTAHRPHIAPLTPPDYLTEQEVGRIFDKSMLALKDVTYYCIVENVNARNASLDTAKTLLTYLLQAIDNDSRSTESENLRNLMQFIIYSLEAVKKRNNPAAAQEALALLQPIRDAFLQLD